MNYWSPDCWEFQSPQHTARYFTNDSTKIGGDREARMGVTQAETGARKRITGRFGVAIQFRLLNQPASMNPIRRKTGHDLARSQFSRAKPAIAGRCVRCYRAEDAPNQTALPKSMHPHN